MTQGSKIPLASIHQVNADGVQVFYREAGPRDAPVVLLLHGFPTSSFQFREFVSIVLLLVDKVYTFLAVPTTV